MKILYENSRFAVVEIGTPGLKIYDKVLERVNLDRFGAFYDNMGWPYPSDAFDAAKQVADKAERQDEEEYGKKFISMESRNFI